MFLVLVYTEKKVFKLQLQKSFGWRMQWVLRTHFKRTITVILNVQCDITVTGIREFDCRNLERNIVQETEKTDVSVQCLSFSHISLISGLLSCVNSPLLCQLVPDHSHGALNMWLFDVIFDLCTSSDHQFHAFSTLKLWFHHMGTRLADMVGEVLKFCCDGHVVKRTLQLVWTHVDSPVDGVNECVIDVLKGLIKLQQDEVGLKREDGAEMEVDQGSIVALILPQVVTLPWNVRGKYSLLTVLLLHLDLDQVSMNHFQLKVMLIATLIILRTCILDDFVIAPL